MAPDSLFAGIEAVTVACAGTAHVRPLLPCARREIVSIQVGSRHRAHVFVLLFSLVLGAVGARARASRRTTHVRRRSWRPPSSAETRPRPSIDLLRASRYADEADPGPLARALQARGRKPQPRRGAAHVRDAGAPRGTCAARAMSLARSRPSTRSATCASFAWSARSTTRASAAFASEQGPESDARMPRCSSTPPTRDASAPCAGARCPTIVHGGYVSFDAVFRPTENVCGFAETSLVRRQRARAHALGRRRRSHQALLQRRRGPLRSRPIARRIPTAASCWWRPAQGENRVLVKTCVTSGTWGFYLRVGDAKGEPLALSADPNDTQKLEKSATVAKTYAGQGRVRAARGQGAAAQSRAPRRSRTWRAFSGTRRRTTPPSAARISSPSAPPSSSRAPSATCWRLSSPTSATRSCASSRRRAALAPKDPEVLFARAQLTSTGPGSERALEQLAAIPPSSVAGWRRASCTRPCCARSGCESSPSRSSVRARARAALHRLARAPRRPALDRGRARTRSSSSSARCSRCATITWARDACCSKTPSHSSARARRSSTSRPCARCSRATRSACSTSRTLTTRSAATT